MYKLCNTEESSRRQRAMEQGLLEAMGDQPYAKITLTDLCRQLGVPRKTFYRYFPTKEDALLALIDHTLSDCNDTVVLGWEGSVRMQYGNLERFFSYWQGQKGFLDAVHSNDLGWLVLDRTTKIVDAMKAGAQEEKLSFSRDQVEYFVAHGLMATVLRWHRHGFPGTPEEMAEVFSGLLRSPDISITKLML